MRKQNLFYMAAALLMGTAALSSCSSDELPVDNVLQTATETAKTYSFSASALMGGGADTRVFEIGEDTISSRFSGDAPVWVFIKKSNGDIACSDQALYPTNISKDGKTCTLAADSLSFYSYTQGFKPEEKDTVYLYYGINIASVSDALDGYGIYEFRASSSKDDVENNMDFCLAEMVVTGVEEESGKLTFGQIENPNKTSFIFRNINSVFRQKLTFVDENGYSVAPENIYLVMISSANNKTIVSYRPYMVTPYQYDYKTFQAYQLDLGTSGGNIYFSTMFNDENKGDAIVFTAYDNDGKTYSCTKKAPTGGFQNNKYYYGDAELKWISDNYAPVVLGLKDYETETNFAGGLDYYIYDNPANFSIFAESYENSFFFYGGTVTLQHINATNSSDFITISGSLTLNLVGYNPISTHNYVIYNLGDPANKLYLKCEKGGEGHLLLTIKKSHQPFQHLNFFGFSNISSDLETYTGEINSSSDQGYTELQKLAADDDGDGTPDYIIKRSALMGDDESGFYYELHVYSK